MLQGKSGYAPSTSIRQRSLRLRLFGQRSEEAFEVDSRQRRSVDAVGWSYRIQEQQHRE